MPRESGHPAGALAAPEKPCGGVWTPAFAGVTPDRGDNRPENPPQTFEKMESAPGIAPRRAPADPDPVRAWFPEAERSLFGVAAGSAGG